MEGLDNTNNKQKLPHRFKPGESGNPAGRPKGAKNFTTKVREALMRVAESEDGKKLDYTYEEALIRSILVKAIKGKDPQMIKLMWNYFDGMPNQTIDLTGELDTYQHRELDQKTEEELKEFITWKRGRLLQ